MADKKTARVRYDDGKESGTEQYVLEKYDWNTGKWSTIMSTPFVNSKEYPDEGNAFIHYPFLIEVIRWTNMGYKVEI